MDVVQFCRKHSAVGSQWGGNGTETRGGGLTGWNVGWSGGKDSQRQVRQPPGQGGVDCCRGEAFCQLWPFGRTHTGTCSNLALHSPEPCGPLNTRATLHVWVPVQVLPRACPPCALGRLAAHLSTLGSGASPQKDASRVPCLLMTRARKGRWELLLHSCKLPGLLHP